jgi:hypothetical protein
MSLAVPAAMTMARAIPPLALIGAWLLGAAAAHAATRLTPANLDEVKARGRAQRRSIEQFLRHDPNVGKLAKINRRAVYLPAHDPSRFHNIRLLPIGEDRALALGISQWGRPALRSHDAHLGRSKTATPEAYTEAATDVDLGRTSVDELRAAVNSLWEAAQTKSLEQFQKDHALREPLPRYDPGSDYLLRVLSGGLVRLNE